MNKITKPCAAHYIGSSSSHRLALILFSALLFSTGAGAQIIYDAGDLSFESDGQSIWGTGTAFRKSEAVFLGMEWTDQTANIGGIAGSPNEEIFPAIGAIAIPVYEARIWRPTPTWSKPWKGTWVGCGCWKDVQIKPATGAITIDTRAGAELKVTTSGRAGLEFGYSIDSGSIDTDVEFSAFANLPETVNAGEFIDIDTSSIFDSGSFETQSPKIEAYISAILELSGDVDAAACAPPLGCATGSFDLPTVNMNQRIVTIDPNSLKILDGVLPNGDALAEIPILNQSLTLEGAATMAPPAVPIIGFKLSAGSVTIASTVPPTPTLEVELAELEVQVPDIATSGQKSGEKITSEGRDDLLSLMMDVDGMATLFAGLPPTGMGFTPIDVGAFKLEVSLDLIDVDIGPVLGITQDFELVPTLVAEVLFSNPVQIEGLVGLQNSWMGLWSDLPEFSIFEDTTISPTFWADAMLRNTLGIDLGLVGTLDLLKLDMSAVVAGIDILSVGPISLNKMLGLENTLFETPKFGFDVYSKAFDLNGFNTIEGQSFTLLVNTDPIADNPVPEPGTLLLLLLGIVPLFYARKKNNNPSTGS